MREFNRPGFSRFAVWHWPWWVWSLLPVLVLVAYPLSIGPVVWLADRHYLPGDWLDVLDFVYFPVGYACSTSDWATEVFDQYVDLWTLKPDDE